MIGYGEIAEPYALFRDGKQDNGIGRMNDVNVSEMDMHELGMYCKNVRKGNSNMKLYLSVSTDLDDLEIDYIEIKLPTGETVFLDWDESDIKRLDNGFYARYKGVYFDEEYANGKLSCLRGMQIDYIGICTESESDSEIVITEMAFEDAGEQYVPEHLLPYVISMEE